MSDEQIEEPEPEPEPEDEYPLRAKRKAAMLEERALREGWATKPEIRRAIVKKTQIRALESKGREAERAANTLIRCEKLEIEKRKLELDELKVELGLDGGATVLINNDNRQINVVSDDQRAAAIIAAIDELSGEPGESESDQDADDAADSS